MESTHVLGKLGLPCLGPWIEREAEPVKTEEEKHSETTVNLGSRHRRKMQKTDVMLLRWVRHEGQPQGCHGGFGGRVMGRHT